MFETTAKGLAHKELQKKKLLSLYRKALTKVSRLKLKILQVDVRASFGVGDFSFYVTVFGVGGSGNVTFYAYGFREIGENEKNIAECLEAIKTDDFPKVAALAKAQR